MTQPSQLRVFPTRSRRRVMPQSQPQPRKHKKIHTVLKSVAIVLAVIVVLVESALIYILHGPNTELRDMYVTTVLATSALKFMATSFLPASTIEQILDSNKVVWDGDGSDPSMIQVAKQEPAVTFSSLPTATPPNVAVVNSATPAPTPVPTPTPTPVPTPDLMADDPRAIEMPEGMEGIQILELKGDNYVGYMAIIADPSRVSVCATRKMGSSGQQLLQMANDRGSVLAVNGGGFDDPDGHGNGGTPYGLVYEGGELLFRDEKAEPYNIIGFNDDDVFVIGKMTYEQTIENNIRDAVVFLDQFLVINGKPSEIIGNGGSGMQPRAAIGQRQDGAILLLTIDGRQTHSIGATLKQVMKIMLDFGAWNAANLDGGSSVEMVFDGKTQNKVCAVGGRPRRLATGFCVAPLTDTVVE